MKDYFAELGLDRRAALPPEMVRAAFQKLGAALHPDSSADAGEKSARNADFSALNEAQAALSSTAQRLAHLTEIETGSPVPRGGPVDEDVMALFLQAAPALQRAAEILTKKSKAQSALGKALLEPDLQSSQEEIESAAASVQSALQALEADLERLDALKQNDADHYATQLVGTARRAAFLEKWSVQLQQMLLRFLIT